MIYPSPFEFVTNELKPDPESKKLQIMTFLNEYNIECLTANSESNSLAQLYVEKGVISKENFSDAKHIAIASVHGIGMIISLNFSHVANNKTIKEINHINEEHGYKNLTILGPVEMVEET